MTEFNRNFPQSWDGPLYQLSYVPETPIYKYDDFSYARESVTTGGAGANIGENAF